MAENIKAVIVEEDYKGYYKRYALTVEEFRERFPETVATFGDPDKDAFSDTIKPLVHIWCMLVEIDSDMWETFFTDMLYGLPEGDIKSGNEAYIDIDECGSLKRYVMPYWQTLQNLSEE